MQVFTHIALCGLFFALTASAGEPNATHHFDFTDSPAKGGVIKIAPSDAYSKVRGSGFDLNTKPGDKPFYFSVDLPEGNYLVTLDLGDAEGESDNTIKVENRRLMLDKVGTAAGKFDSRTITVNIRTAAISTGGQVRLKAREQSYAHWDNKLTIEFNGVRPRVRSIHIAPAKDVVTVYLAGDSTVTDQDKEPWASWGQMLPLFFKPGVAVANHAESGEALKSFSSEKRLDKILSLIQPGDYLFIQFTHNDQKAGSAHVEPFTTYKQELLRYANEARKKQAIPVLVTSMHRRSFAAGGKVNNTLGDYPAAMRELARDEKIALVDLNAMSKPFYESLGAEKSKKAFVDNTHHNAFGAHQLAKCVIEGIEKRKLELAKQIIDGLPAYDPAKPDDVETFAIPASPMSSAIKPDGN